MVRKLILNAPAATQAQGRPDQSARIQHILCQSLDAIRLLM